MARYVPDAGEIVWLQFNPQTGHEAGRTLARRGSQSSELQRDYRTDDLLPRDHENQRVSV